jgi:hypothetical protein
MTNHNLPSFHQLAKPVSQLPNENNEFILTFEKWLKNYHAPSKATNYQREKQPFLELLVNWKNEMQSWNLHKLKKYLDFIEIADNNAIVKEHEKELITTEKLALPLIIKKIQDELPGKGEDKKIKKLQDLKKYVEFFLERTDLRIYEIEKRLEKAIPIKNELDLKFDHAKDKDKLDFETVIGPRQKITALFTNLTKSKKLYEEFRHDLEASYHQLEKKLKI